MDTTFAAAVSVRCDHTSVDSGHFADADDRAPFDWGLILSSQSKVATKEKYQSYKAESCYDFFFQYILLFLLPAYSLAVLFHFVWVKNENGGEGLSDIGGFRPNLTQPSRVVLRGNPTEADPKTV